MTPNKGPCVVFIEELGDKHTVPYRYLKPYPRNETWVPTCQRYYFKRNPNGVCDMNGLLHNNKRVSTKRNKKYESAKCETNVYKKSNTDSFQYVDTNESVDLIQYTDLANYQPTYPYEIVAMPMSVHRSDRSGMGHGNKSNRNTGGMNQQQQQHQQQQQPAIMEKSAMGATPQPQDESDINRNNGDCVPSQLNSNEMMVPTTGGPSGLVQYYYSPYGQPAYDQSAYNGSAEMATTQAIYPIPAGMPYTNAIPMSGPNNAIYTPVPVGMWPPNSGNWI
jgi:hypothetical protein